MSSGFAIHCPSCHAGYLLPGHLLGSQGARVTCPACGHAFSVERDGLVIADAESAAARRAPGPEPAATDGERVIARDVLDALALRLGPAIEAAARDGALFGRHGPDLLAAYDEYRRRAGERVGLQAFRDELHHRWRVDLFPAAEARG